MTTTLTTPEILATTAALTAALDAVRAERDAYQATLPRHTIGRPLDAVSMYRLQAMERGIEYLEGLLADAG